MAETNKISPDTLARQFREEAMLKAEDIYAADIKAAAEAKEQAITVAASAKATVVKHSKEILELAKKRVNDVSDKIEKKSRLRDERGGKNVQEQRLIKAEEARIKAVGQAADLYKRRTAEAAEARKRALQKAVEDGKKIKLEAAIAEKAQKVAADSVAKRERKSVEATAKEAADAKIREKKSKAAKDIARKAIEKSKGKTFTGTSAPSSLGEKPSLVTPQKEPDKVEDSEKALRTVKPVKPAISVNRSGMIKLIIANDGTDAEYMAKFENNLGQIPGIRVVMTGGDTKEGGQIIVSSEKPVALSEYLRKLPHVADAVDRHSDIMITLQPLMVFKHNQTSINV